MSTSFSPSRGSNATLSSLVTCIMLVSCAFIVDKTDAQLCDQSEFLTITNHMNRETCAEYDIVGANGWTAVAHLFSSTFMFGCDVTLRFRDVKITQSFAFQMSHHSDWCNSTEGGSKPPKLMFINSEIVGSVNLTTQQDGAVYLGGDSHQIFVNFSAINSTFTTKIAQDKAFRIMQNDNPIGHPVKFASMSFENSSIKMMPGSFPFAAALHFAPRNNLFEFSGFKFLLENSTINVTKTSADMGSVVEIYALSFGDTGSKKISFKDGSQFKIMGDSLLTLTSKPSNRAILRAIRLRNVAMLHVSQFLIDSSELRIEAPNVDSAAHLGGVVFEQGWFMRNANNGAATEDVVVIEQSKLSFTGSNITECAPLLLINDADLTVTSKAPTIAAKVVNNEINIAGTPSGEIGNNQIAMFVDTRANSPNGLTELERFNVRANGNTVTLGLVFPAFLGSRGDTVVSGLAIAYPSREAFIQLDRNSVNLMFATEQGAAVPTSGAPSYRVRMLLHGDQLNVAVLGGQRSMINVTANRFTGGNVGMHAAEVYLAEFGSDDRKIGKHPVGYQFCNMDMFVDSNRVELMNSRQIHLVVWNKLDGGTNLTLSSVIVHNNTVATVDGAFDFPPKLLDLPVSMLQKGGEKIRVLVVNNSMDIAWADQDPDAKPHGFVTIDMKVPPADTPTPPLLAVERNSLTFRELSGPWSLVLLKSTSSKGIGIQSGAATGLLDLFSGKEHPNDADLSFFIRQNEIKFGDPSPEFTLGILLDARDVATSVNIYLRGIISIANNRVEPLTPKATFAHAEVRLAYFDNAVLLTGDFRVTGNTLVGTTLRLAPAIDISRNIAYWGGNGLLVHGNHLEGISRTRNLENFHEPLQPTGSMTAAGLLRIAEQPDNVFNPQQPYVTVTENTMSYRATATEGDDKVVFVDLWETKTMSETKLVVNVSSNTVTEVGSSAEGLRQFSFFVIGEFQKEETLQITLRNNTVQAFVRGDPAAAANAHNEAKASTFLASFGGMHLIGHLCHIDVAQNDVTATCHDASSHIECTGIDVRNNLGFFGTPEEARNMQSQASVSIAGNAFSFDGGTKTDLVAVNFNNDVAVTNVALTIKDSTIRIKSSDNENGVRLAGVENEGRFVVITSHETFSSFVFIHHNDIRLHLADPISAKTVGIVAHGVRLKGFESTLDPDTLTTDSCVVSFHDNDIKVSGIDKTSAVFGLSLEGLDASQKNSKRLRVYMQRNDIRINGVMWRSSIANAKLPVAAGVQVNTIKTEGPSSKAFVYVEGNTVEMQNVTFAAGMLFHKTNLVLQGQLSVQNNNITLQAPEEDPKAGITAADLGGEAYRRLSGVQLPETMMSGRGAPAEMNASVGIILNTVSIVARGTLFDVSAIRVDKVLAYGQVTGIPTFETMSPIVFERNTIEVDVHSEEFSAMPDSKTMCTAVKASVPDTNAVFRQPFGLMAQSNTINLKCGGSGMMTSSAILYTSDNENVAPVVMYPSGVGIERNKITFTHSEMANSVNFTAIAVHGVFFQTGVMVMDHNEIVASGSGASNEGHFWTIGVSSCQFTSSPWARVHNNTVVTGNAQLRSPNALQHSHGIVVYRSNFTGSMHFNVTDNVVEVYGGTIATGLFLGSLIVDEATLRIEDNVLTSEAIGYAWGTMLSKTTTTKATLNVNRNVISTTTHGTSENDVTESLWPGFAISLRLRGSSFTESTVFIKNNDVKSTARFVSGRAVAMWVGATSFVGEETGVETQFEDNVFDVTDGSKELVPGVAFVGAVVFSHTTVDTPFAFYGSSGGYTRYINPYQSADTATMRYGGIVFDELIHSSRRWNYIKYHNVTVAANGPGEVAGLVLGFGGVGLSNKGKVHLFGNEISVIGTSTRHGDSVHAGISVHSSSSSGDYEIQENRIDVSSSSAKRQMGIHAYPMTGNTAKIIDNQVSLSASNSAEITACLDVGVDSRFTNANRFKNCQFEVSTLTCHTATSNYASMVNLRGDTELSQSTLQVSDSKLTATNTVTVAFVTTRADSLQHDGITFDLAPQGDSNVILVNTNFSIDATRGKQFFLFDWKLASSPPLVATVTNVSVVNDMKTTTADIANQPAVFGAPKRVELECVFVDDMGRMLDEYQLAQEVVVSDRCTQPPQPASATKTLLSDDPKSRSMTLMPVAPTAEPTNATDVPTATNTTGAPNATDLGTLEPTANDPNITHSPANVTDVNASDATGPDATNAPTEAPGATTLPPSPTPKPCDPATSSADAILGIGGSVAVTRLPAGPDAVKVAVAASDLVDAPGGFVTLAVSLSIRGKLGTNATLGRPTPAVRSLSESASFAVAPDTTGLTDTRTLVLRLTPGPVEFHRKVRQLTFLLDRESLWCNRERLGAVAPAQGSGDNWAVNVTVEASRLPEAVPQRVQDAIQSTAGTAASASAVIGGAPTTSLSATKLAALMSLTYCEFDHEENLDVLANPLNFGFGARHGFFYRGAVVGGIVLLLSCGAVVVVGGSAVFALRREHMANADVGLGADGVPYLTLWRRTLAFLHVPGVLIIPFVLVTQGLSASATALFIHAADGADYGWGVLGLLACWGPWAMVFALTRTSVFACDLQERPAEEVAERIGVLGRTVQLIWGSKVKWVDRSGDHTFKKHFMHLFVDYRLRGYLAMEIAAANVVGVLQGIRIESDAACTGVMASIATVVAFLTVNGLVRRPSVDLYNGFFLQTINAATALAAILLLAGHLADNDDVRAAEQYVALAGMALGVVKFCTDCCFIVIWLKGYGCERLSAKWSTGFKDFRSQKYAITDTEMDKMGGEDARLADPLLEVGEACDVSDDPLEDLSEDTSKSIPVKAEMSLDLGDDPADADLDRLLGSRRASAMLLDVPEELPASGLVPSPTSWSANTRKHGDAHRVFEEIQHGLQHGTLENYGSALGYRDEGDDIL